MLLFNFCVINVLFLQNVYFSQNPNKVHALGITDMCFKCPLIYSSLPISSFYFAIYLLKKLGHVFYSVSSLWILQTTPPWCHLMCSSVLLIVIIGPGGSSYSGSCLAASLFLWHEQNVFYFSLLLTNG